MVKRKFLNVILKATRKTAIIIFIILKIIMTNETNKKNFLNCFVREIETQYWAIFNIEINVHDLKRFPINDIGYAKLTMMKKKEKDQYWCTHYIVENNYVKKDYPKQDYQKEEVKVDELPF